MLSMKNSTWVTSDTHYGHKNIIKFQQRPESHELFMLYEWIRLVPEKADILHLGDVFMGKQGNPEKWSAVVSRLPGTKYLIMGNHDKCKPHIYAQAGFKIIEPFIWHGVAFTHRPITPEWPMVPYAAFPGHGWHTNIHGHIHGNKLGDVVEHDGSPIEGKKYINVSVEVMDYKPRQVGGLL